MELEGIDHVAVTVTDVDRSTDWYREVLGMERRHMEWGKHPAMVCVGETCVALFPLAADKPDPPPSSEALAMRHLAFRVRREGFEAAQSELLARGIEFSFEDHDIAHSIYFSDPDGHQLEITTYDLGG